MTATMPEPPDRSLVGLFDPAGQDLPLIFVRDDTEDATHGDDHWLASESSVSRNWPGLVRAAAECGREVVRLYRADDPAITINAAVAG